jgi:hypothetical protein
MQKRQSRLDEAERPEFFTSVLPLIQELPENKSLLSDSGPSLLKTPSNHCNDIFWGLGESIEKNLQRKA